MLSFKSLILKKKFIITLFIPSLFSFLKGRHEKIINQKCKTTKNYLYCFFNSIIRSFLKQQAFFCKNKCSGFKKRSFLKRTKFPLTKINCKERKQGWPIALPPTAQILRYLWKKYLGPKKHNPLSQQGSADFTGAWTRSYMRKGQ